MTLPSESIRIMILYILFGVGIFCLFMMYRSYWVYRKLINLVRKFYAENPQTFKERIDKYLDPDSMLWKFWIWDIEKLKK